MSVSEELDDLSVLDELDIPEVVRDEPDLPLPMGQGTRRGLAPLFLLGGLGAALVAVGAIAIWQFVLVPSIPTELGDNSTTVVEDSEDANTATTTPEPTPEEPNQLLGHYAYDEAPSGALEFIYPGGTLKLRPAAADKYRQMVAAARRDGINLNLISAFRSVEEQQYLFFEVKEQRGQNTAKRAEVSAPPNHSEHHTGYAIDIGDGNVPATNLSENFENTAAFRWLDNNAARYSFELSFPRNNGQGIAYEPWHWRFVGDQDSLETFYKSRSSTETAPGINTETGN